MAGPRLFNPTRASTDELETTFTGREELVAQLQADLQSDAESGSVRHWQIVGPRGSGKSHLTEVLARRLQAQGWDVARLPEEQYRVASLADFLEQIVETLSDADSPFREESDPDKVIEMALDWIAARREREQRPVAVVVENLGTFLSKKLKGKKEQQRLRGLLLTDPPFLLVATATSVSAVTTSHEAPFYDFFQTVRLDDLSGDEVGTLVRRRAEWDDATELLENWDEVLPRIKTLMHFSGGNPRLVLALYQVLAEGLSRSLVDQLLRLLDEVTPYYQARLEDLAPQPQRVLVEIALAERVMTPAEIATRLRLPTNQVTSVLARLEAERFVRKTARVDGRSRLVEVSDRLFRIWLQMREARRPNEKLRFLVEFYRGWYGGRSEEATRVASRSAGRFWEAIKTGNVVNASDEALNLDYLAEALGGDGVGVWATLLEAEGPLSEAEVATLAAIERETQSDTTSAVVEFCRRRREGSDLPIDLFRRLAPAAAGLGGHFGSALLARTFVCPIPECTEALQIADEATGPANAFLPFAMALRLDAATMTESFVRSISRARSLFDDVFALKFTLANMTLVQQVDRYWALASLIGESFADTASAEVRAVLEPLLDASYIESDGLEVIRSFVSSRVPDEVDHVLRATVATLLLLRPRSSKRVFQLALDLLERAGRQPLTARVLLGAWVADGMSVPLPQIAPTLKRLGLSLNAGAVDRAVGVSLNKHWGPTFLELWEAGFSAADSPFAEAIEVRDSDNPTLALARLHPEVRPAVRWLLGEGTMEPE